MKSQLTIAIPTNATGGRVDLLARAIDSALAQTVPVRIAISDDSGMGDVRRRLEADYPAHMAAGRIRHEAFDADHAWPNWRHAAEMADTEYVAWLQDDDVVRATYAGRIIAAFDKFPDANLWMARLACAPDGRLAMWYSGNGPWVPMDLLGGSISSFREGSILVSSSYLTSWSLAPAMAFRRGPWLDSALARMPAWCDIFVERLMPAMVADGGPFIADPVIAGYWVQHDDNLSRKQHADQPRQTRVLIDELDELMPRYDGWQRSFSAWLDLIPTGQVIQWMGILEQAEREGRKSPYIDEIRGLLTASIRPRVRCIPMGRPWWRRAYDWCRARAAL